MKDTRRSQDWRALCELASRELDPEKLIDLVTKINKALEDARQESGDRINGRRYRVSSQFSQPVVFDC